MNIRRSLGVLLLATVITAVGCSTTPPPPPAPGPETVLAEMTARTRFGHIRPAIVFRTDTKGVSYALCPNTLAIGIDASDPELAWTLAHEWGHIMACGSSYMPPDFPFWVNPKPSTWMGPAVWQWENWADCVAEALTGIDGAPGRNYPSCNDEQDAWTKSYLGLTTVG